MMWVLVLLISVMVHAGDVLMLDLNDSDDEVNGCVQAVDDNNAATGKHDRVHVVGLGDTVNEDTVEAAIKRAEERDHMSFDTIIVSGHDGSGEYFGSHGALTSAELAEVVQHRSDAVLAENAADGGHRVPLNQSLTGMALWGCYTGNVNSAVNFWMRNVSPSIKATVGFSLQAPLSTAPASKVLLNQYCGANRARIANAASEAEMSDIMHQMNPKNRWNLSICYPNGICSEDYALPGDTSGSCYHSYGELYARCSSFDPGSKLLNMYTGYNTATTDRYAEPPPDKQTYYTQAGDAGVEAGELRSYYSQLHLWYHCAGQIQHAAGYIMPNPMAVIRLVKFDQFKRNFAANNKAELDQYNQILAATGLDSFTLDPANQTRKDIVARTSGAGAYLDALEQKNPTAKINGYSVHWLKTMAYGFDATLRELQPDCSPFNYVDPGGHGHSQCVARYGVVPAWPSQ